MTTTVLDLLAFGGDQDAAIAAPHRFFAWLEEAEPTWYTAVPTRHQAILRRAARNQEIIRKVKLRFIQSSSSSLSPQVM